MKRVQSACIFQTLVFLQKDEGLLTPEKMLFINREEVKKYKESLERAKTRYQIDEEKEREDGSILLRVRKQYNDKCDVSEYFN